jgi:endonuclease/exonuclease/phosphatase family metal-dependent hydrolase
VLNNQLLGATATKKDVVVVGDMNLDQEKWDEKSYSSYNLAEELRTCLSMCGLEIHELGKTYFSNHVCGKAEEMPSSAIDHVYSCTKRPINVKSGTLLRGMSDHLPIIEFDGEAFERDLVLHGGLVSIGYDKQTFPANNFVNRSRCGQDFLTTKL